MVIKVAKDSKTVKYFSRHQKVKMKLLYPDIETGEMLEEYHNWKIVATDKYSFDRIMEVYLDEWYDNEAEDAMIESEEEVPDLEVPHIEGPADIHVFDENLTFSIVGYTQGEFSVNSSKVKIINSTETSCTINILTGKSCSFILTYIPTVGEKVQKVINVKSF